MIPDIKKLNLTANPFEDFELLEETLGQGVLSTHGLLFKDRTEITRSLLLGVTTSTSYKVALHGEAGVGKSSLLNKVLLELRKIGYFAVKYRVGVAAGADASLFEREMLRAFGDEIVREASRNKGFLDRLKAIVQLETRNELRQFSILALLYSTGQVTIREGKVEANGLSVTVGLPFVNAQVSEQEQKQIEVTRVETLSHMVFEKLLQDGISLLKELGYQGIVFAVDEIDKLEERFEPQILTLVKDTFYPTSLCHILLVMKTRNGRKAIHQDIFTYEPVYALPKPYVMEFLVELYRSKAIDQSKQLSSVIDPKLLDQLYEANNGIIRLILKDLRASVIRALVSGKTFIDRQVYNETKTTDALQAYLLSLQPSQVEYKILSFLVSKGETYARDKKLSRVAERERSTLSERLDDLEARQLLISKKRGRNRVFSIDPNMLSRIKAVIG
jgi:hypothetical protein